MWRCDLLHLRLHCSLATVLSRTDVRKDYIEQIQRMHNKVDMLEAQVRKMTNDPRPSDSNRCYECGDEGHFGRDCPERAIKLAKREAAKAVATLEAAKKEK